jgi:hypothetical protein
MALSFLQFIGLDGNVFVFKADIGTNHFYRYKIGKDKREVNGLTLIDKILSESKVIQSGIENPFNSSFEFKVPAHLFPSDSRYIQLYSFKDNKGKGPALSEVVEVIPMMKKLTNEWPIMSSVKSTAMDITYTPTFNKSRNVGFSFQESEISHALFWDSLLDAARVLAPIAVNAISGLLGSNGALGPIKTEDVLKIINVLADAVKENKKEDAPAPAGPTPVTNAPLPTAVTPGSATNPPGKEPAVVKPSSLYVNPYSVLKESASSYSPKYSKAQFVDGGIITGPILATLLAPLLSKAPELLKIVADNPIKLLNIVSQANLQKKLQEQQFIENLVASANQNMILQQLLRNANGASSVPGVSMMSSVVSSDKIKINFEHTNSIDINGKPKFVYNTSSKIKLLLNIRTDLTPPQKPIPKSIVQLVFKDPLTLKNLGTKNYKLKEVFVNSILELELLPEDLKSLPIHQDILINASFKWQSNDGTTNATNEENYLIWLTSDYFFISLGDKVQEDIELSDMKKYREFWNKIWEGGTKTKSRWKIAFDTKYYVCYKMDASSNGRVETKIKMNNDENQDSESHHLFVDAKLKSGLELSLEELNKLLPTLSQYPSLDAAHLEALKTEEMGKIVNQQASSRLKMKGNRDETGAIWVFPSFSIYKIKLGKSMDVDANGQLKSIKEEEIYFPIPVDLHFLGLKTEGESSSSEDENDSSVEESDAGNNLVKERKQVVVEGYKTMFDIKVALTSVDLIPVTNKTTLN